MSRERSILHFNIADFAVAVEQVADRSLKQRPVIVAPLRAVRAVVYDMSDEAYRAGVRKGMPLTAATRLCRDASVLQPRVDLYRRAMQDFVKEVRGYSPQIEYGVEDGHLFVDLTGTHRLWGPAADIGLRVRREVRNRLELDPIWALGTSRLVAKVASRLVKPVGEYIVAPGEEREFLEPLPVELLPGLQESELRQLREFHIGRIGELAGFSRHQLMVPFGSRCDYLYEVSRGVDHSEVGTESDRSATLEYEQCFATDTNDRKVVEGALAFLVAKTGLELRRRREVARRVGVWICYSDGGHVVRQASVKVGTSSDFTLCRLASEALQRAWLRRVRLRALRLVCDRLHRESPQLSLFPEAGLKELRRDRVLQAMDAIRSRYGHAAIGRGGSPATC